jgi:NAD(P)H-hydrate epimerase
LQTRRGIVYLTAEEMAEFDRAAIEDFGIDEAALMENAGLATASLAKDILGGAVGGKRIDFLVGKGNNGGDGLVAARHLHNWGARTTLVAAVESASLRGLPAKQLAILEKMGVHPSGPDTRLDGSDLLIDALFGYNLKGNPREPMAGMIRRGNSSKVPILAVDIPSGLDATTGEPGDPCIVADDTLTLGLPKVGFLAPRAKSHLGNLYLADISFPGRLYASHSQKLGLFNAGPLVRIW